MKVNDIMHKGVEWVDPYTPVAELAKTMKAEDISAIPVGENDRLIGMVTDRDIALRAIANGKDISQVSARDVQQLRESWPVRPTFHKEWGLNSPPLTAVGKYEDLG